MRDCSVKQMLILLAGGPVPAAAGAGSQPPAPFHSPQVFKTDVDLVQLEVTVLDERGQPVRGRRLRSLGFSRTDTPGVDSDVLAGPGAAPVRSMPSWMQQVASDVVSKRRRPVGRLIS